MNIKFCGQWQREREVDVSQSPMMTAEGPGKYGRREKLILFPQQNTINEYLWPMAERGGEREGERGTCVTISNDDG